MANLGGEASTEIDAPIDEVWAVVEDIAAAPEWQDGLESMDPLERDGEGRVLVAEPVSDAKVRKVTTRVRFAYDPPHSVRWHQEKGDLKKLDTAGKTDAVADAALKFKGSFEPMTYEEGLQRMGPVRNPNENRPV